MPHTAYPMRPPGTMCGVVSHVTWGVVVPPHGRGCVPAWVGMCARMGGVVHAAWVWVMRHVVGGGCECHVGT